ncbi:helix-turn-helix domain-containing protein [Burkholderia multivorans]|jgi:transcriptional regulator with XRE-family HTH domain|uniref:helix-turn-helix domain-containing protein n=1 Tax=Burkholderia multivorans TaxID=87883 RepID=UPI001C21E9C1|nr:helix-turn-helix transcriptional regulator [Burkholderia multivorans]MBU9200346.1 helix-turn-helix domain-containing protein [Burkholderia multivorans]MDN8078528.1 helix-turn-helix transcriptional regulator [Burkholderia multivorans]
MRTLSDIAAFLRTRLKATHITQRELGEHAGIARRTLTGVLSGQADYKVSTLMAVLDRLGCELAVVPKGAAAGLAESTAEPAQPSVKTRVQLAREKLRKTPGEH